VTYCKFKKKLLFITGTRADYGKIKSVIKKTINEKFNVRIFVTGMHLSKKFGETFHEVKKNFNRHHIFKFKNFKNNLSQDIILANTIYGVSKFLKKFKPDMVIVHGDRVESLACAISASFNNILVAHIEGGEISGNIDEHIRHSISKLSHIHLVSNKIAKNRILKMGELKKNVFEVGSPDIDIMSSKNLPNINQVKERYGINFKKYCIGMFHPVTSEIKKTKNQTEIFLKSLVKSNQNFILIYPNNDPGNEFIIKAYKKLNNLNQFRIIKSMRFEFFLTLLKNSDLIIGNSSCGVIEAPFYGIPTINIGNRQNKRSKENSIINITFNEKLIRRNIKKYIKIKFKKSKLYGNGNADKKIVNILKKEKIWQTQTQKTLSD